jgi:hypothetical protein
MLALLASYMLVESALDCMPVLLVVPGCSWALPMEQGCMPVLQDTQDCKTALPMAQGYMTARPVAPDCMPV